MSSEEKRTGAIVDCLRYEETLDLWRTTLPTDNDIDWCAEHVKNCKTTAHALKKVVIIRTDGRHEEHEVGKRCLLDWIRQMLKAHNLDSVNLRDGRVMLVDDTGMVDGLPVNAEATKLYHAVCRPGTTAPICGDVAVALDEDFA